LTAISTTRHIKKKKNNHSITYSNIIGKNSYFGHQVEVLNIKLEVFQHAHKHICLLG